MPSDLQFEAESVGIWLRAEKVPSEFGNVVELWQLGEAPDLDPVVALRSYMKRRSDLFGSNNTLPVFIHEDGSNLSKSEFNKNLKTLLSQYPGLVDSSVDFWAGHSFRSGLSTLLQTLGFSEEEIKSWGRWRSSAYLRYLKDISARRKTKAKLVDTFHQILSNI